MLCAADAAGVLQLWCLWKSKPTASWIMHTFWETWGGNDDFYRYNLLGDFHAHSVWFQIYKSVCEYWHCSCVVTEFDPIVFFPFRAQNANFPNSRCENTPLIGRESPPPSVSVVFPVKAPHKSIQSAPLHQRKNWRTKLETVSFILRDMLNEAN